MLAGAAGSPVIGGAAFAVFMGTLALMVRRKWLFEPKLDVRIERVGAATRLRVTRTAITVRPPFTVVGASRMDGSHLLLKLAVTGAGGTQTTIGAIAEASDELPPQDDWFDGARLADDELAPERMVEPPKRLIELRDELASLRT